MFIGVTADPRGWALWRSPRKAIALVFLVYCSAALSVLPAELPDTGALARFGALALCGSTTSLVCLRMERARKFLEANVPNLTAVWTFAGALCLDHLLAVALVAVIYGVQWFTQKTLYVGKVHRYVFGACTVVIGVRAAQAVPDPWLSGVVFLAVNMVLIAAARTALGNIRTVRRMLDPREQGTEILTLMLGLMTAGLVEAHLALALLTVPVTVALQYVCLCRSIRQRSTFDSQTGALTNRAWHALATLRLAQVSEAIVFHVVFAKSPELPMRECGKILRAAVRQEDLIGRMADGFTVLVAAPTGTLLTEMLSLQIRARFARCGIETFVGSATTPQCGRPVNVQDLAVAASAEVIVQASDVGV